jgi:two-component system NarL family response regulator
MRSMKTRNPFALEALSPLLERQVLQGMRSASQVFVVVYLVSILLWSLLWLLPPSPKSDITRATGSYNFGYGEALMIVVGACEVIYFLWLRRSVRDDRPFPRILNFVIAFLECFQPTFFLWTWGLVLPPEEALSQSPLFFYFLLIGSGALRMDALLSLFSGFVSGAGFIGLSYLLYVKAGSLQPWKDVTSLHFSKGVYLLICGALMAFVASQVRRRLVASLDARMALERMTRESEERERAEQERQTIAVLREREILVQELHDTVTQKIAWVSVAAQTLRMRLDTGESGKVRDDLERLARIATEAQIDVRDFIHDARSASVLVRGFIPTLVEYLATIESEYGMHVDLRDKSEGSASSLDPDQQVIAFKIIQEAVNNSRKHAGTMAAVVSIEALQGGCRFIVEDEGRGFDLSMPLPASHYGLDIMKSRAAQVGGTLAIDAMPGRGVRVTVEFAFGRNLSKTEAMRDAVPGAALSAAGGEGREKSVSGSPANEGQHSRARLVVIDDHELFREGLCGLLRLSGFSVLASVGSAAEGLERLRELQPDLVLMDIHMPGLDGIRATARMKAEFPEARIVLLTGSSDPGTIFEAVKVGASAFLLKTAQARELVGTIEGVLEGEIDFGPEMAERLLAAFPQEAPEEAVSPQAPSGIERLSPRQREILGFVAGGLTYKEVGVRLYLTERTIKYHMGEIVSLLQVKNKAEAARLARSAGL